MADAVAIVGLTEAIWRSSSRSGWAGNVHNCSGRTAHRLEEPDDASITGVQAIVLGLLTSVLLGVPAALYAPQRLNWVGASPANVAGGSTYIGITRGGCGPILMLFLNNATFGVPAILQSPCVCCGCRTSSIYCLIRANSSRRTLIVEEESR